jgi:hypothetical protein
MSAPLTAKRPRQVKRRSPRFNLRSLPQPPVVLNLGMVQIIASLGMPIRQAA